MYNGRGEEDVNVYILDGEFVETGKNTRAVLLLHKQFHFK